MAQNQEQGLGDATIVRRREMKETLADGREITWVRTLFEHGAGMGSVVLDKKIWSKDAEKNAIRETIQKARSEQVEEKVKL